MAKTAGPMTGARYSAALDLRLSKNYNSVGVHVEFGRDANPGETREALVRDVHDEVQRRLAELAQYADELLSSTNSNDKKKKGDSF